jgi:hypothetical protein
MRMEEAAQLQARASSVLEIAGNTPFAAFSLNS